MACRSSWSILGHSTGSGTIIPDMFFLPANFSLLTVFTLLQVSLLLIGSTLSRMANTMFTGTVRQQSCLNTCQNGTQSGCRIRPFRREHSVLGPYPTIVVRMPASWIGYCILPSVAKIDDSVTAKPLPSAHDAPTAPECCALTSNLSILPLFIWGFHIAIHLAKLLVTSAGGH